MRYAVLRTHGGLGNQLFQILYGRLFAEAKRCVLREVHDSKYKHQFPRALVPAASICPSLWQSVVSAARIPKVHNRILGLAEAPYRLFGVWYLDGYFQHPEQYSIFTDKSIRLQLNHLALELDIKPAFEDARLVHLRVGDFFGNRDSAKRHVLNRLQSIPIGSHIMTNDEALLEDPDISELMTKQRAYIVTTQGFSSEQVLKTIARYRQVDANDSTLTLWAHVLAGTKVNFSNQRLAMLAAKLGDIGPTKFTTHQLQPDHKPKTY